MKIKCTNCGKRFDYDLYAGLCPHCGVYMRQSSMDHTSDPSPVFTPREQRTAPESSRKPAPGSAPKSVQKPAPGSTSESAQRPFSRRYVFRTNRITTVLLIIILPLMIVIPAAYSQYRFRAQKQELTLMNDTPVRQKKWTDSVTISTDDGDFKISVLSAEPDNDPAFETPDGYEVLAVSYHVEIPSNILEDYPSQENENRLYSYTHWQYGSVLAYGVTKSGSYLKPISDYDLARVKDVDYDAQKETGIGDTIDSQNGCLYFLVKKKDFKGILINEVDPDTDVLINSYLMKK